MQSSAPPGQNFHSSGSQPHGQHPPSSHSRHEGHHHHGSGGQGYSSHHGAKSSSDTEMGGAHQRGSNGGGSHSGMTPPLTNSGDQAGSSSAPGYSSRLSRQWGARSVDQFMKVEQIGEGQYGQVWLAREKDGDKALVALKKVKMDNEKEGFPITAIREIKILKNLRHKNIVQLREIVTSKAHEHNKQKGSVYMVFEYAEHDLAGLILSHKVRLEKNHIKAYLKQLLEGLHYLHTQKILHRDIKGANLLITDSGLLKIADFGLARSYNDSTVPLTKKVITLWYRPPEVLLESDKYGTPADIWSVGCIFAELLLKYATNQYRNVWSLPNYEGPHNETEQLAKIFDVCGTPTKETWPEFHTLPGCKNVKFKQKPNVLKDHLRKYCKEIHEDEVDLCEKLLTCNPSKRLTATAALEHSYFWTDPMPAAPENMPRFKEPQHEWQVKKKRSMEREAAKKQAMGQGAPGQGGRPGQPPAGGGARDIGGPPQKQQRMS
eukprot:CAMPEP_0177710428 /NCGR_PEP_ID=MMETSP0484_2-20121128/11330_1 /TAXON_ID=354590 /ORGANISM="Rhodomonas lens, Strain RHODO" /LENGTH=489 /DNA_ID=CAMNT_0019222109 /DNA_START=89 /DNA_END=1558 /DNA_ORIENTATION=+